MARSSTLVAPGTALGLSGVSSYSSLMALSKAKAGGPKPYLLLGRPTAYASYRLGAVLSSRARCKIKHSHKKFCDCSHRKQNIPEMLSAFPGYRSSLFKLRWPGF